MSIKPFAYQFGKVDISLHNDVVTIYMKTEPQNPQTEQELTEVNQSEDEFEGFCIEYLYTIGLSEFIEFDDLDHSSCHDDGFDEEISHYHMKFDEVVHAALLAQLLDCLLKGGYIELHEAQPCLLSYQTHCWLASRNNPPVINAEPKYAELTAQSPRFFAGVAASEPPPRPPQPYTANIT